jgi:P27 family predicted phage terminase small subunit
MDQSPPEELPPAAIDFWNLIVPQLVEVGRVNDLDRPALAQMCLAWSYCKEAEREITRTGRYQTIKAKTGSKYTQTSPAVNDQKTQDVNLQRWFKLFGLVPAGRGRILPVPVTTPDSGGPKAPSLDDFEREFRPSEPPGPLISSSLHRQRQPKKRAAKKKPAAKPPKGRKPRG